MENENDSPKNVKTGDSIKIAAVTFAILILTIVVVTTLLNNNKICALDTHTTQLEARLLLQEETSGLLQKQLDSALVVLKKLEAQLEAVKAEMTSSLVEQNEKLKTLSNQVTQLESNLKVEPVVLPEEQNDKLKEVEPENSATEVQNDQTESLN